MKQKYIYTDELFTWFSNGSILQVQSPEASSRGPTAKIEEMERSIMKRKFLAMTLALAMGLSLAACGGGSASTPAPAETGEVEALKEETENK